MTTVTTPNSQGRNVQVYFLAAPEDQDVCEVIHKYLKPIIRSSKVPIEVNSDFNIPSGEDTEKYKQRLFEADIVLALISQDFISNDDTYNRNQKVSERHNNDEAIIIPILVRNCLWKSTPFVHMNILPKSEQPLNNKQYWNSPDDAVTAVVEDIYTSIYQLTAAYAQSETMQPLPVAEMESAPDLMTPVATSMPQAEPDNSLKELAQTQSEVVQPASIAEAESAPDLRAPIEASMPQTEPAALLKELAQVPSEVVQPGPVTEIKSAPELKAASIAAVSQAKASSPIAADWRQKYYRAVALKRAGAILLDHVFLVIVWFVLLVIMYIIFPDFPDQGIPVIAYILYFVLMPMMESSKWQGTIGKRILKLQITDREGDRITFLRAFWRNVMRTLVLYLYFLTAGSLLVVQYFRFNKTRKLFQDKLSGTVIGERLSSSAAAPDVVHAMSATTGARKHSSKECSR